MYPDSQPAPNDPMPGQYFGGPPAGQYFVAQPQRPVFAQPTNFQQNPNDLNFLLTPLVGTDKVIVKQKKEMLEIFTSWETNNRYEIYNGLGKLIYYAFEDSSASSLCCLGKHRPFCIRVVNFQGQQVMVVNSSVACCTRDVTVQVPEGRVVSNISQEFAFFASSFYVNDSSGGLVFKVKSPLSAAIGSLSDVQFDILSSDQRTVVGQISKQWSGFFREWLTDADIFGLSFPADMDAVWKAVLLAVTFVVDFEFYEKSNRN